MGILYAYDGRYFAIEYNREIELSYAEVLEYLRHNWVVEILEQPKLGDMLPCMTQMTQKNTSPK